MKGVINMLIRENSNTELRDNIRMGLERTGGYCPCKVVKSDENKCICDEFRSQIADPDFEGFCSCQLYYKEK